jgi:peroxiredoxin Q/BCP
MTDCPFSGMLWPIMGKDLGIGSKAPAFALKNQNGETVNLESILEQGPVALVFYPGDLTPGCTIQLCAIRDDWEEFQKAGVQVFGVNPANTDSHKRFTEKHRLPFPLLVDENRKVTKIYGAEQDLLITKIVRRTVVGIDRDGRIIYYRQGMPRNTEILKAFKT